VHPQAEQEFIFKTAFAGRGIWRVGVVHLVVLARVLRVTTKKVVNFLRKSEPSPRENPGYAYRPMPVLLLRCRGAGCLKRTKVKLKKTLLSSDLKNLPTES